MMLKRIFSGYKKIKPTIVQIIIAAFILPVLCNILSLLLRENNTASLLTKIISEFSLAEVWFGLLTAFADSPDFVLGLTEYATIMNYIDSSIFEACMIGMCVGLCKNIGVLLGIPGVPIIQSILGVFLGCITISAFGITNEIGTIYACIFLVILNIIVIWLIPTGDLLSATAYTRKLLATFLGLGLQMIIAALAAGYVICLIYIMNGTLTDLKTTVICLVGMFVPFLIIILFDYFFLTPEKNSLGL